jgi:nitrate reductase delta subunit
MTRAMVRTKPGRLRMGAFKTESGHVDAVERVQAWTRERFGLPSDGAVLVSELECRRPGCPPLETLVAFWLEDDQRRHFRVFKPLAEVVESDLPPAWLKDALCAEPSDEFTCC